MGQDAMFVWRWGSTSVEARWKLEMKCLDCAWVRVSAPLDGVVRKRDRLRWKLTADGDLWYGDVSGYKC